MTLSRWLAPACACVLGALFLCLLPVSASAAWNAQGNPVCVAAGAQTSPSAVADGTGGMIVTWLDARPGATGIYALRLLSDGSVGPGWPVDGVLCSGVTPAGVPFPVPDGAGGVLIVWYMNGVIYAQRVDAGGAMHSGWPADGVTIVPSDQTMPHGFAAVTDGGGGAYITRVQFGGSVQRLIITRITADGTFSPGWSQGGMVLMQDYNVSLFGIKPDPSGGVVCATGGRFDCPVCPDQLYGLIERIGPSGSSTSIATPSGQVPGGTVQAAGAADGGGGLYGTWHYYDTGSATHSYSGQHKDAGGTMLWATPYNVPLSEQVIQDGSVGVWYAGRAPGTQRLEVHRRLWDGALPPGWAAAGVVITTPASLGAVATVSMPDALVLCWSDNGAGGAFDIRAISVGQDGVIPSSWDPGGSPVCTASGDQTVPFLLADGAGGVLACWEDRRAGASVPDIYAKRIDLAGAVSVGPEPPRTGILGAWPNPARESIEVSFALPGAAPALLELFDLAGRSLRRVALSAGEDRGSESLAIGDLANGVYFLRVTQGPWAAATRIAVAR